MRRAPGEEPRLAIPAALMAASFERDAEIRASRPPQPSTSSRPYRCSTCGHWNAATNWTCSDCGLPFVARAA